VPFLHGPIWAKQRWDSLRALHLLRPIFCKVRLALEAQQSESLSLRRLPLDYSPYAFSTG
jgi:hypothetical protein